MILVVDFACRGFSHEEFNAGTLFYIRKAFENEPIFYLAEYEQTECVKNILLNKSKISDIEMLKTDKDVAAGGDILKAIQIKLEGILASNKEIDRILITSITEDAFDYLKRLINRYSETKFIICLHGSVELLLPPIKWESKFYIHRFRRDMERKRLYVNRVKIVDLYRKQIEEYVKLKNCSFIAFNDSFIKTDLGKLNCMKAKTEIIHLPYIYIPVPDKIDSEKIRIGLMPSSVDDNYENCIEIIDGVNKRLKEYRTKYEFVSCNYLIKRFLKNTEVYLLEDKTRKSIDKFFSTIDYLLIPYGINKYRISSSGVMFDAISQDVPVIMYSSKCFDMYKKYNIGLSGTDIEGMVDTIVHQIKQGKDEKHREMIDNIHRLKKNMDRENIEKFKKILN